MAAKSFQFLPRTTHSTRFCNRPTKVFVSVAPEKIRLSAFRAKLQKQMHLRLHPPIDAVSRSKEERVVMVSKMLFHFYVKSSCILSKNSNTLPPDINRWRRRRCNSTKYFHLLFFHSHFLAALLLI